MTEQSKEVKLKPCGFCGSDWVGLKSAADGSVYKEFSYVISCGNCGAIGPWKGLEEYAIQAWNTRAQGWTSVKNELPEEGVEVLIFDRNEDIFCGHYSHKFNDWFSDIEIEYPLDRGRVTHWQHLPEPPQEKK